jgi:hypothetical protein
MSCVTCHMSNIMCHMSRVTCHFFNSGEAYWWRVCYQRGLPRLVFRHIQEFWDFRLFLFLSTISLHKTGSFEFCLSRNQTNCCFLALVHRRSIIVHKITCSVKQGRWPPELISCSDLTKQPLLSIRVARLLLIQGCPVARLQDNIDFTEQVQFKCYLKQDFYVILIPDY